MHERLSEPYEEQTELFEIGERIIAIVHVQDLDGSWQIVDIVSGTSHHIPSVDENGKQKLSQGILLNEASFKYTTKGDKVPSRAPRSISDRPFEVDGVNFRVTVELVTSRSDILQDQG